MNRLFCPYCDRRLTYDALRAGQNATCPKCGESFSLPNRLDEDCPKCSSVIAYDYDRVGTTINCTECGHSLELPSRDEVLELLRAEIDELVLDWVRHTSANFDPAIARADKAKVAGALLAHGLNKAGEITAKIEREKPKDQIARALSVIAYYAETADREAERKAERRRAIGEQGLLYCGIGFALFLAAIVLSFITPILFYGALLFGVVLMFRGAWALLTGRAVN
jgi:DNA-directed RNA polymerase subunit M/transcription elongation factor TFIIS